MENSGSGGILLQGSGIFLRSAMDMRQLTRLWMALALACMLGSQVLGAQCAVRCGLQAAAVQHCSDSGMAKGCSMQGRHSPDRKPCIGNHCAESLVCASPMQNAFPQRADQAQASAPTLLDHSPLVAESASLLANKAAQASYWRHRTKPPQAELCLQTFTSLRI